MYILQISHISLSSQEAFSTLLASLLIQKLSQKKKLYNTGIKLYKSETEEIPGEIIYEDEFQIAIINEVEGLEVAVTELNKDE